MICLIFGSDTDRSHEKFQNLMARFLDGEGSLAVFRMEAESASKEYLSDVSKAEGLFNKKSLIVGKRLFENEFASDCVMNSLDKMSISHNIFLLWEEQVEKKLLKKIEKYTENLWRFDLKGPHQKKIEEKKKTIFKLTDAIALRDKNKSWLCYQEELFGGTSPEDIFWIILWQVRTLLSVKKNSGKELHPYVYKKTKNAVQFFSEGELKKYYEMLVDLLHKSRIGKADLAVGIEKFILKI